MEAIIVSVDTAELLLEYNRTQQEVYIKMGWSQMADWHKGRGDFIQKMLDEYPRHTF